MILSPSSIADAVHDTDSAAYTPETEDQLQKRLVQLLNLPQAPKDPHIRWTSSEEEDEEGGSSLSLNVTQLAESLRALPIHTRLGLPTELLQHYGVNENDLVFTASGSEAHSDTTSPPITSSGPSTEEQSTIAHATTSNSVDLKSLFSKSNDTRHTFDFSALSKKAEGTSGLLSVHLLTSRIADEDNGLGSLLQTSSQFPTPHGHKAPLHTGTQLPTPHGHKAPGSQLLVSHGDILDPCASHTAQPGGLSAREAVTLNSNATVEQTLPTTAELDDMLDDLLA